MFNAILWDMDGTLVDTERVAWQVMRDAFLRGAGVELSQQLFESLLGRSEADFYRALAPRYSLTADAIASVQAAFDAAYLPTLAKVPALPGAVEKVREFAGYAPQALVTGSTTAQANAVLEALRLASHFRHVVACDVYQRGKPDPEPYLLAASLLGVEPASCLVIEDSPAGVDAAKAAGMKVAAVHAGNAGRYNIAHADLELQTLQELCWPLRL